MMERWLALAWLLDSGLLTVSGFEDRLDDAFADAPEDDFFLELEWAAGDRSEIIALIRERSAETVPDPKRLKYWLVIELAGLSAHWPLPEFARLAYGLWLELPPELALTSPLAVLNRIDDPLAWEDEAAVRTSLDAIFAYARHSDDCADPIERR